MHFFKTEWVLFIVKHFENSGIVPFQIFVPVKGIIAVLSFHYERSLLK